MIESRDGQTREQESALVEQARDDPAAFGRLYELHVHKIYNYVYYRTGNHHDAEDLTARQDAGASDLSPGLRGESLARSPSRPVAGVGGR